MRLDALIVPTYYLVTEELEGKKLTAKLIAREYGHGDAWDRIMKDVVGWGLIFFVTFAKLFS